MGVPAGCIDVTDEYAQRDVYTMEQWAQQYGAQKADGVELYSEDGSDYQLITQSGLGAGQTVLCVPIDIAISSEAVANEFGGSLQQAEQFLVNIDQGTQARLPLFKLMMKVLAEYEKGEQSVYYPWLNSLPRQFYNGVAMTDACYDCLPPYAGWLTSNERVNYSHFAAAARQGFVPISQEVLGNDAIMKWAYNVAYTRFHEIWQPNRQKLLIPMADMVSVQIHIIIDLDALSLFVVFFARQIDLHKTLTPLCLLVKYNISSTTAPKPMSKSPSITWVTPTLPQSTTSPLALPSPFLLAIHPIPHPSLLNTDSCPMIALPSSVRLCTLILRFRSWDMSLGIC